MAISSVKALYAGTSGWAYATWKPDFYPPKTSAKNFLSYYATRCNSVEVNYTFRTLPSPSTLANWLGATPENFRFSFKAPQRVTHFKRLVDCGSLVEEFILSLQPVRAANKLGLILFQLPPNFKANPDLLASLLDLRSLNGLQLAFEFRNATWFDDATYSVLRQHNAALCIAENEDLQTPEIHTSTTHTCFRLRMPGGYTSTQIKKQLAHFQKLTTDRTVYAYFKHEDEPTGALCASALLDFAVKQGTSR